MNNFTYQNPTRIHFGKGQINKIDLELPQSARVLLLAGGGSIRNNGVYEQVKASLGERKVWEQWGVEANPDYDTLMPAVELCKREEIEWVLAVGGGSVIDGAKFVCAATLFDGEPWDILSKDAPVSAALPLATVLTLPGTGTEANGASVISRRSIGQKLAFITPKCYPRFSILDPKTTFSLPNRQIANGVADALTHILEQYMTHPAQAEVQDRFAESLMRILIELGPQTVSHPNDYDVRSNIVWACTWALNGSLGVGVPQDWASHMIGHEITALHGIDHARTLALVMPSLLTHCFEHKEAKLAQCAERVWGIQNGDTRTKALRAIDLIKQFYSSLGLHTSADKACPNVSVGELAINVANRLAARDDLPLGEGQFIHKDDVIKIIEGFAS
jgi:NADP-dependent alcohol dehydrogenase